MSKKDASGTNGDTLSDEQVRVLADNQITYDPATNDAYDSEGMQLSPSVVASVIGMSEDPPSGSDWHKGFDALGLRIESNALGQPSLRYPPETGTPPGTFDRPGTAIDSDGLMGTPAESQAQRPEPLDAGDGEFGHAGPGVSPPPSALAQARAEGASLWSRLVPSGEVLKADHRAAHDGRCATGPTNLPGRPAGPSHEVAQVNLSGDRSAAAFIGSAVAPMPASVPTIRVVPPEETKGATL